MSVRLDLLARDIAAAYRRPWWAFWRPRPTVEQVYAQLRRTLIGPAEPLAIVVASVPPDGEPAPGMADPRRCEVPVAHPDGGVGDCPNWARHFASGTWLCSGHAEAAGWIRRLP